MMNRFLVCFLLAVSAGALNAQGLPTIDLSVGMYRIKAEVASTNATRQKGLMERTNMAQHEGMLFVFDELKPHCFWMKNTPLPLSIAFLDATGKIVNIEDMQPRTEDTHCAKQPVYYALEMNQGWFAKRGLKVGTVINGVAK